MIKFVGGTPVPIKLEESMGFAFNIDNFKKLISPKTKMVIINTPQNPTGGILNESEIRQIAEILKIIKKYLQKSNG